MINSMSFYEQASMPACACACAGLRAFAPVGHPFRMTLTLIRSGGGAAAAKFIANQVMSHPNQVVILSLGGLTNVANTLRFMPKIKDCVKVCLTTCARAYVQGAETTCL